ncbi:MAG TPA: YfhO family protein [Verrucomicrobiae bacterium]|jgi:hypothetical protein|nr:YfhO family protein [Verrucomicrobiae bacterium]
MPAKILPGTRAKSWNPFLPIAGLLALLLGLFFYQSFIPQEVVFSNDGPLGVLVEDQNQLPQTFTGFWADLNSIGSGGGMASPAISSLLRTVIGPLGYAKFFAPLALFILGLGALTFFRALKFSMLAMALGTLAAVLNATYFSDACWGVASHEIAAGMDFFALGLVMSNTAETPWTIRWTRLALAGLCVGMNVMEAADIGALYSILIAIFVFYKSVADSDGTALKKIAHGIGRVAVISLFAGFIAYQTVIALVGTAITGIAGTGQDTQTKAAHWDFASQWSLPKTETFGLFVPGLFGYKMNTPMDMMPALQDTYRGGVYWGGMGRDPELDRFFDRGGQGTPPPSGFMRQTGGGNYCGILVALIAAWAIAQSFRRQNSPFTGTQKKYIWFWSAALVGSLLLSWGRFAPFDYYRHTLYALPYFSTIRSPAKFVIFLSWAMVILFGYGIHALSRRHLEAPSGKSSSFSMQIKNWWTKASRFDRRWTFSYLGIFGASVIGWFIYASKKPALVHYLQTRGFPDEESARQIITFSIGQVGWWLVIFAAAIVLLTLIIAGCFAGKRAKLGGWLLGAFLVMDLGRADLPYVNYWDYKQKYEVGSLNPVENFLRDKPYEHRVAKLLPAPLSTPSQFQLFDQLYGIEWTQHHFPYYNIQSLDIIQMPRMPEDLLEYMNDFRIGIKQDASGQYMLDETTFPKLTRLWELSNTRYLLGPAGFLDAFNTQFDPGKNRFHIVQRFNVLPRPGIAIPDGISPEQYAYYLPPDKVTAFPNTDGSYALFDFTGALPRAKLYSNWQVNTNDQAVLKTLADLDFDPAKTVLVSTPQKDLPAVATNENSGTVEFKSYAPKRIIFAANAPEPSVLLLNDKYDPDWRVTVDGKPAELLRCNYIMRGVYLPAGSHTVEFQFIVPIKPLYVTLAAIATGIFLIGLLIFLQRRKTAI